MSKIWEIVTTLAKGVQSGLQLAYAPQTVTALATRENTKEQIAANYNMEAARLSVQRQNTIDNITANFQLQEERHEFQAQMEIRRENFEVAKLKAQWLHQYDLQKDAQEFNYQEARRRHEESVALAKLNMEHQQKIEEFRQHWENLRLQKRQEFELQLFKERQKHEWELKHYERETQMLIAAKQLANTMQSGEYLRILDKHPLVTLTTPTLDFYRTLKSSQQVPLLIIISPPAVEFEQYPHAAQGFAKIETRLTDDLREFLYVEYPIHSVTRPTKFLGGVWETRRLHAEGAMEILHWTHKSVPTLVLESKVAGDVVNLYVASWDMMDTKYHYRRIMSIPWKEVLYPLARENARLWREDRNRLVDEGRTPKEIEEEGGDDEFNLKVLEAEERDQKRGSSKLRDYKVQGEEYTKHLSEFLGFCHKIIASLVADQYHLFHYNVTPRLPELLPELLEKVPNNALKQELIKVIVSTYQGIYQAIKLLNPSAIPELALELARSLTQLEDKTWVRGQLNYALLSWLELRDVMLGQEEDLNQASGEFTQTLLTTMASVLAPIDVKYVGKVNCCLDVLGESQVSVVTVCYNRGINRGKAGEYQQAIVDFSQVIELSPQLVDAYYNRGVAYGRLEQYQQAIDDYTQVLKLQSNHANAYNNRGNAYYKLGEYQKAIDDYNQAIGLKPNWAEAEKNRDIARGVLDEINRRKQDDEAARKSREDEVARKGVEFEFDIVIVDASGNETTRSRGKARQQVENLSKTVSLEMVYIPEGSFMMGSPGSGNESPQHEVTVASFYMGRYPVTQAQWKAVVALPKVKTSLNPDPSNFKGDNRPVENVSWHEAEEFCARLSQKTGKTYRLPSEAEWEYAARAQTTTSFHFGDTITPKIANFSNNSRQTTDVGIFKVANAFGLYDIHGNVWEWCADPYHGNYSKAPVDGRVWEADGNYSCRMRRGGSWDNDPTDCRCAYRNGNSPDYRDNDIGFRVAVSVAWTH